MSDEQAQQPDQADDPSGPGWRDLEPHEILQAGDMFKHGGYWQATQHAGQPAVDEWTYRRRIEPQQPSDSEPETIDDLRRRLAEAESLLAEADRGGQQVNAELQQLRGQLATSQHLAEMSRRQVQDEAGKVEQLKQQLWDAVEARQKAERELKDTNEAYQICLQSHYKAGQRSTIDRLQAWLRPVLKVVSDHPDHSSILAAAVLEFLPQIAGRLIEE